ncbi:toll/interleukin-1 receptor domain-containing protein [Mesorhizobium sp. M0663]|uniref:toll/interleukin-1 receptor domain-containing protein n=2 Tax=Mesorhizobium TaxID=68287 RepID=UPI003339B623
MVSDSPVQIFVSYARNDDVSPPDEPAKKGFITALYDQLHYRFRDYGDPKPKLWRDVRQVDQADQFDKKIAEAIEASALMLAVLSPNWMSSDYCKQELKIFTDRWRSDESGIRERIIVVGKRHVANDRRPSLLQGQSGIQFYALDDPDEVDLEREFFVHGVSRDNQYYERLDELAKVLRRRAVRYASHEMTPPPEAISLKPRPTSDRAVYLAKPASDTRSAYDRMVVELTNSGYTIVPDPAKDIPVDSTAVKFVDDALSTADFSIHLLGEKPGFAPDDAEPIVKLQLSRAAQKAANEEDARKLKRIIWAPKILDLNAAGSEQGLRDPLEVLSRFGSYMDTDAVEGDTLSKFVELVAQRLSRAVVPQQTFDETPANARMYVYHRPEDIGYAYEIGMALRARDITPRFPAVEGTDAERVRLHKQNLRECDAVVVCWASAPDVWAKVSSNELVDWKTLGRTKRFTRRGLVAGPPPGMPKKMGVQFYSKDEIDVAIDLTALPNPPGPDDLAPLLA